VLSDKKQVYIVDDDIGVGRALMILLTTYGFKAQAFVSAKDFFAAVPNNAGGCLILDIHMPGTDGWKTMEQIDPAGRKRPIILISADMGERVQELTLKSGVMGFLQKPFNNVALLGLVNRAFDAVTGP
jgi:FixJ family two-component response regulator